MTRYHEAKLGRSRFWQIGSFLVEDRREPRYRPERILRERRRGEKKKTWAASRECALKGNGGMVTDRSFPRTIGMSTFDLSLTLDEIFFLFSFFPPLACFLYLSVCLSGWLSVVGETQHSLTRNEFGNSLFPR